MSKIPTILEAFQKVTAETSAPAAEWVSPFESGDKPAHQFVFFIKPEATAVHDGVNLEALLGLVMGALEQHNVSCGAIRVLNGNYLAEHSIMDQHYGVINSISKGGRAAISQGAEATLEKDFGDQLAAGVPVLGGHEFVEQQADFSPLALSTLNDNIGTSKLAGGTYVLSFKLAGSPQLVLNPFHPYQLVPFTTPGRAIIVIEGLSDTPWSDLRNKLTGATDPSKAAIGSIRNLLLENQATTGMKDVSQGTNGVHLSAGPLEGMVELRRFFADPDAGTSLALADTAFGQALLAKGISADQLSALAENPDFDHEGSSESAFDLSEEMDASAAADLLHGCSS
jgi:hypothetical protein